MPSNSSARIAAKEAKTSFIWIEIKNGPIQPVEEDFSIVCPRIRQEMYSTGKGFFKNNPIHLPEEVSPDMLSLIVQYWKYHRIRGRSDKERRSFDEKFVKTNSHCLVKLSSAAHALCLKPLIDLIAQALACRFDGSSNDEIRKMFHVPDDLTEEEKLQPLNNPTNDRRIQLLNQLLAKKRKIWKEQNELKNMDLVNRQEDTRSVEQLLEFINGKGKAPECPRTCTSEKKKSKRKNEAQNSSLNDLDMTDTQDSTRIPINDYDSEYYSDQEKIRENDRIVAEFARRLNIVIYY